MKAVANLDLVCVYSDATLKYCFEVFGIKIAKTNTSNTPIFRNEAKSVDVLRIVILLPTSVSFSCN